MYISNEELGSVSYNFSVIDKCQMNKVELLIRTVYFDYYIIYNKHLSPVGCRSPRS